ncbi:hypothetical protein CTI12_AA606530 [Artemisia annua]|uniref:Reverse transcriptase domain-containing protein n=1 Tax=Artemisia annua TaxID=35608 RepID=A0A2U1KG85_ARTAN|nr:hypothetical protein CTI12_AA606530 [Artemisia annua]
MTAAKGLEKIDEIARHSSAWHAKQEPVSYKPDELCSILKNIEKVESDMNSFTVEVNMVQHSFDDPINGRVTDLERVIKKFIKDSYQNQRKNQETIWGIKMEYDGVLKSQANVIRKLEAQVGKLAKTIKDIGASELPSTTETNPRDLAHAITTRSRLNYKEPAYPTMTYNEKATSNNDLDKSTPVTVEIDPKPYVPPIPFPGRMRRQKEQEHFQRFFERVRDLSINIRLVEALEKMPKYARFMKDLVTRKRQGNPSRVTLNERCSSRSMKYANFTDDDIDDFDEMDSIMDDFVQESLPQEQLHSIISEGGGEPESPVPLEGDELHETAKGAESIP